MWGLELLFENFDLSFRRPTPSSGNERRIKKPQLYSLLCNILSFPDDAVIGESLELKVF